jgi:hypothetical protein
MVIDFKMFPFAARSKSLATKMKKSKAILFLVPWESPLIGCVLMTKAANQIKMLKS